jgi:hypothetical protein
MKISVKIPSRGRPNELIETLNRWSIYAHNISQVEFIVSLDNDDETMKNPEIIAQLIKIPNCKYFFGNNKSKQEAVNADLDKVTGDIIFHICDDVICEQMGWDDKIIKDMKENFPHLNGVLHYPDGIQDEKICTHPVIGKNYLKKFGYISHPSYKSLWADNEFTEVAKHLGKIKYIDTKFFEHDHPMKGNRKADALNSRDDANFGPDQRNYFDRLKGGFDGLIVSGVKQSNVGSVLIAVLSNGEWKGKTAANISGLVLHCAYNCWREFRIRAILEEQCSVVSVGRNHAIQQALQVKGLTHILFIDADATFPVNALETLYHQDKDVIACNALSRKPPFAPVCVKREDGKWTMGCHFMLINMRIFNLIKFPWFDGHYQENGEYRGEDQDFCDKVNEFSRVDCDEELSEHIGHLGEMNFVMSMRSKAAAPQPQPA